MRIQHIHIVSGQNQAKMNIWKDIVHESCIRLEERMFFLVENFLEIKGECTDGTC